MTGDKVCGTCRYGKIMCKEDKNYIENCIDCKMVIEMTNWEPREVDDDERECEGCTINA